MSSNTTQAPPRPAHSAGFHQRRFLWLLAAWAVAYLASTFVIVEALAIQAWLRWAVSLAPSILAVVAVAAYWRYLREADELARLIELHGLKYAVSAGFVIWPATELLTRAGLAMETAPSIPVLVMIAAYSLGTMATRRRYQ